MDFLSDKTDHNISAIMATGAESISNPSEGSIEIFFGPMFSGKSSLLINRLKRAFHANLSSLLIKHSIDTRFQDLIIKDDIDDDYISRDIDDKFSQITESKYMKKGYIVTHDKAILHGIECKYLLPLIPDIDDFDVIGIDEGQFFEDIIEFAETMAGLGKKIIISSLDGDYKRNPFKVRPHCQSITDLIPKAEFVHKLAAICVKCHQNAYFSFRYVHPTRSSESADDNVVFVGASETYFPVCRACYTYFEEHCDDIDNPIIQQLTS
jgi:thymidine kinase